MAMFMFDISDSWQVSACYLKIQTISENFNLDSELTLKKWYGKDAQTFSASNNTVYIFHNLTVIKQNSKRT